NESLLSQLEAQNDETIDVMTDKVKLLKNLTIKMGTEIKSANLNSLSDTFDKTSSSLKRNFNNLLIVSKNAGISWKSWLIFFILVFGFFFWVWIF
ncbi:Bet1p ASCRUDRAFT_26247, partial [Ascoidea rubescens DSM 1968]